MSQPSKNNLRTSRWPILGSAGLPFFSGMRYRMQGLTAKSSRRLPKHVVDAILSGKYDGDSDFRSLSFTFSVIALSAKVACADGELTRDKYVAFRDSFPLKGNMCGKIRSLFTLACNNTTPTEHYVGQIKHIFPDRPELFTSLMERLFGIATTEGTLTRESERMLGAIAHGLGIPTSDFSDMCARYSHPNLTSAQAVQVLGVTAKIKASALKKRYHELMRSYHPDRFAGQDLSPEVFMLLQLKSAEINAAYRVLARG